LQVLLAANAHQLVRLGDDAKGVVRLQSNLFLD
jgi:hypothetical protein